MRFVDFIRRLVVGRSAPVIEPTVVDPILADLDAMLAELLAEPSPAPVAAPAPELAPAPIAATITPSAEELAILAELEGLFADDATTPAGTKTSTNSSAENPAIAQGTPTSPAHGAGVCPVASLTPPYTPTKPTPIIPLWKRLRTSQPSPLSHLLGTPASPFKLPTVISSTTWSRSTPADKFAQAIRSSQTRNGAAITLNLSQAREEALRASRDPAGLLATYINRAMKVELGKVLPFAVQLEISPAGRLHAHGVVCLDQATMVELDALKRALATAGGKIKGHAGSRQVKVAELYDADGWTAYFSKTRSGTVTALGTDKVGMVSSSLRALAEQDWTVGLVPGLAKPSPACV